MIEIFNNILSSDAGSFGFVMSLLFMFGWMIYFVTKKVTNIDADHSGLSRSVDKIDSSLDEIRRDISYLKGSIDVIKSGTGNYLLQSKSPVSLTDKGLQVAQDLHASTIIASNWDNIFSILEKEISDKNAYDIQQFCIERVSVEPDKFIDSKSLTSIKNYAFKEGNPLQIYTRLLGVMIRDEYMKRKGISSDEIDKHDPAKQ